MDVAPVISPESFEYLRVQSQRCLIEFLDAELKLGVTFVETSGSARELGNFEHAEQARREAAKAAETIRHFLDRLSRTNSGVLVEPDHLYVIPPNVVLKIKDGARETSAQRRGHAEDEIGKARTSSARAA